MTFEFPYTDDRLMGSIHRVDGASVSISLPRARHLAQSIYGQRLGLGEIGEFIIIDVGGDGVLARLLEVRSQDLDYSLETSAAHEENARAQGHAQLLCTVRRDGSYLRGVARHPRIGDNVYTASDDLIRNVLAGIDSAGGGSEGPLLSIGFLRAAQNVEVALSASRLLGRHLAIVGATGGGKSWSLARIVEAVSGAGGRLLLLDATGEFHSLGALAQHWSVSSSTPSEAQCGHTYLPHHEFNEQDRFAFLRPSSGVQLPKLRSAIRSLRLAEVLGAAHPIVTNGLIHKAKRPRASIIPEEVQHEGVLNDPHASFDLRKLPEQIRHECVYETDLRDPTLFGDWNMQEISYCSSLGSRILDLLQTPQIVDVISPATIGPVSVLEALDAWRNDPTAPRVFRISLQDVAFSHNLREIVVNTLGSRLLGYARRSEFKTSPLIVAVDEAHQFFGRSIGDEFTQAQLDSFDLIAKEGRKYGLTLCLATQRPGDIPAGVLSQAGMLLVHRLADRRDRERVEEACSELDQSATRLLPSLIPGEALLVGADFPVPLPVQVTPPTRPPTSQGPRFDIWQV